MILHGLLIAASGFLFIFSPGLPIGFLSRRSPPLKRELIYWGIGLWLVALIPSLFLQSLLRQIFIGNRALQGEPVDYLISLLGTLITAIFVTGAMVLVLRRWRNTTTDTRPNGLALGFGVGLVAQVFTGLSLVGAGFRVMYGQVDSPILSALAPASLPALILGLLALILYRPALLVVSAVQGVLADRAITGGWGFFVLALLASTFFAWTILALQLALGSENPGQMLLGNTDPLISTITILYYIMAFFVAYRWLVSQFSGRSPGRSKGKKS